MQASIRQATAQDVAEIARIYRWSVENESASYEVAAPSPTVMGERMQRIQEAGLPYLVAEVRDVDTPSEGQSRVVGFGYASPFRSRAGYRFTVEDTVYVDPEAQRMGVGRGLLQRLITACVDSGHRQMLAVIGGANPAPSVALHRSCGFIEVGCLKSIGFKFGEWHDVIIMQRELARSSPVADTD